MKREVKKVFYILYGMALLTGCSSEDDGLKPAGSDGRVPLRIAASIHTQANGITRASETSWEANDKIGVYLTEHNLATLYEDMNHKKGENIEYTFDDGTNFETLDAQSTIFYREFIASSGKIYLSDTHVDVYGYYPYSVTKKDGKTALDPTAIEIDVSDQASQKAIDFMRAEKADVNNGTAAIELLFKHKLVKLVFNLKQGDDLLTDELKNASYLGMTIGDQYTTATYDIYNDQFVFSGSHSTIIPYKASSAPTGYVRTFEAIVLPNVGLNSPIDRTVTITFYKKTEDQIVNTFKIPSSTRFEAGYKYIYDVTVNATSIQVNTENKYTEQW